MNINDETSDEQSETIIKNIEQQINKKLIEKQRKDLEKELDDLKSRQHMKGRTAAIFNLKEKVIGKKKESQESVSIVDPVTKERLFDHDKIKQASLNYVKNLLKNNDPKQEYKHEIDVVNALHDVRMREVIENDENEHFTEEDFENILEKL